MLEIPVEYIHCNVKLWFLLLHIIQYQRQSQFHFQGKDGNLVDGASNTYERMYN